jgi:hypothetical protein
MFFAAGDSQDTQTSAAAKQGSSSTNTRDTDMEDVDKFVDSLKYKESQSQDVEEPESQNFKVSQSLDYKESENLLGNKNNRKIFSYILGFSCNSLHPWVNRSFNLMVLLNFSRVNYSRIP